MISFIGYSDRSAGITRGIQVSRALKGAEFINVNSLNTTIKNRIVVFVRWFDCNFAKRLKLAGIKVGFDVLDIPVADLHNAYKGGGSAIDWSRYVNDNVDRYVG